MSPICVHIEMPIFLKKYLIANSQNRVEPLIFRRKHEYNLLLIRLVSNYPTSQVDFSKNMVKIQLPFSDIKDVYFYNNLSIQSKEKFRVQVKRDFYFDLRLFIKDTSFLGLTRKGAIEIFCKYYNITDDDINIESLYRNYTRYIKTRRITSYKTTKTELNMDNVLKIQKA